MLYMIIQTKWILFCFIQIYITLGRQIMHIIGCLKTFFTRPWVRAIQSEKLVMPIDLLFAFGYKMSVTGSNVIRSKLNGMFSGSLLDKNCIT